MRSTGHPDYVYRPMPDERRKKRSIASKARLGIPPDQRLLFGIMVPEDRYEAIKPLATFLRQKASPDIGPVHALIDLLLRCPDLESAEERAHLLRALSLLAERDEYLKLRSSPDAT